MELRGDAVTVATTTGFYLRYDAGREVFVLSTNQDMAAGRVVTLYGCYGHCKRK